MLTITREFHFHAAHRLQLPSLSEEKNSELYGDCAKLHGHTYRLLITVTGPLRDSGMIIDFGELQRIVKEVVLSRYDHAFLNELEEFRNRSATAENIVTTIFDNLSQRLDEEGVRITQVTIFETASSSATITADA